MYRFYQYTTLRDCFLYDHQALYTLPCIPLTICYILFLYLFYYIFNYISHFLEKKFAANFPYKKKKYHFSVHRQNVKAFLLDNLKHYIYWLLSANSYLRFTQVTSILLLLCFTTSGCPSSKIFFFLNILYLFLFFLSHICDIKIFQGGNSNDCKILSLQRRL